ncbi:hypothetical protein A5482_015360 (plasmid) [Cyanobacterium sp. IPPAS B-1200]|uniref:hypothetical protein n=1 Tax=Cyanobacterium sp. IPPAS B-1200 TaxID=1562720 RepID=UPI0008526E97|nr:hypothetical protein [Cyanobacterium sp. IPPAS B-1200]OEJ78441.1 hypothetical protein A5482_13140 [Cyanobacterium sp. IPPAS B-1200]
MSQNLSQNINIKIRYFIDYWRDFSSNDGIEEQQVHTIVYSPKELFKEFGEEVIYSQWGLSSNRTENHAKAKVLSLSKFQEPTF